MKAKDLMIGDWVQFHHKGVKKVSETPPRCKTVDVDYVGQIKGIYIDINNEKGDFAIKTLPNEYEKVIGLHMVRDFLINPIPLTAEILEKNGFKYDELPKFAVNEITEKTKMTFSYHSGSRTVFVGVNEPNFNLTSACVLYIHELQHILRQSRIEKEIIL